MWVTIYAYRKMYNFSTVNSIPIRMTNLFFQYFCLHLIHFDFEYRMSVIFHINKRYPCYYTCRCCTISMHYKLIKCNFETSIETSVWILTFSKIYSSAKSLLNWLMLNYNLMNLNDSFKYYQNRYFSPLKLFNIFKFLFFVMTSKALRYNFSILYYILFFLQLKLNNLNFVLIFFLIISKIAIL